MPLAHAYIRSDCTIPTDILEDAVMVAVSEALTCDEGLLVPTDILYDYRLVDNSLHRPDVVLEVHATPYPERSENLAQRKKRLYAALAFVFPDVTFGIAIMLNLDDWVSSTFDTPTVDEINEIRDIQAVWDLAERSRGPIIDTSKLRPGQYFGL